MASPTIEQQTRLILSRWKKKCLLKTSDGYYNTDTNTLEHYARAYHDLHVLGQRIAELEAELAAEKMEKAQMSVALDRIAMLLTDTPAGGWGNYQEAVYQAGMIAKASNRREPTSAGRTWTRARTRPRPLATAAREEMDMSETLGTQLYFNHTLTARGLVSRDFVYQASKDAATVIVWSRGNAGSEIYYEGERYVPETLGTLAALDAARDEAARLRALVVGICDAAVREPTPGDWYPEDTYIICKVCGERTHWADFEHAPDCPVAAARRALENATP